MKTFIHQNSPAAAKFVVRIAGVFDDLPPTHEYLALQLPTKDWQIRYIRVLGDVDWKSYGYIYSHKYKDAKTLQKANHIDPGYWIELSEEELFSELL
jgi:hypothetical protein